MEESVREQWHNPSGWLIRCWSLFKQYLNLLDLIVSEDRESDRLVWRGMFLKVGHEHIPVDDAGVVHCDDDVPTDDDPFVSDIDLLFPSL